MHGDGGLLRVDSDAVLGAVSLLYQGAPWTISGALDFSGGWLGTRRFIPLAAGSADADATNGDVGLHGRVAYRLAGRRTYAEPWLEVDVSHVWLDGFEETGPTPFNLAVHGARDWVVAATPGITVGTRVDAGGRAAVNVYAGAGVEVASGRVFSLDARFIDAAATADTCRARFGMDDVVARVLGGVELFGSGRVDARIGYEGRLSTHMREDTVSARLAYRF